MSKITVTLQLRKKTVAPGVAVAALLFALTDSAGAAHSKSVTPDQYAFSDGQPYAQVVYEDGEVPTGTFSGSIQALDANGANIGDPVPFSAPENDQWMPDSVSVTVG